MSIQELEVEDNWDDDEDDGDLADAESDCDEEELEALVAELGDAGVADHVQLEWAGVTPTVAAAPAEASAEENTAGAAAAEAPPVQVGAMTVGVRERVSAWADEYEDLNNGLQTLHLYVAHHNVDQGAHSLAATT